MKAAHWTALAAALALLAACGEQEVILPGKRIDVRAEVPGTPPDRTAEAERPAIAFSAPTPVASGAWTHKAGGPAHRIAHPALSARPQLIWSAGIGQGNSRKNRITADPVVSGGRIFTLDALARVTATSTSGETLWSTDLTPPTDRSSDASGGGLAVADGRLFVTTGFGAVSALDPASGAELWTQRLDAPATGMPTVYDGLVYVVSRDNTAWAIDTGTGRVRWQLPGTPSPSGMMGAAGPAVTDKVAVFPFGSGELVAALRQGGVRLWGASLSGQRRGRVYAQITDVTADPVVAGDVIYTGNQSGRAVAVGLRSGERLWTADHGAYSPVWVSGGSVFLISDEARLVRLDAETGAEIWATDLPYFQRDRGRRRKAIFAHFGPVLAGGQLWVASSDGTLAAYDPTTGVEAASIELPGGAASGMAVANRTLYVVSRRGQLHAFR